MQKAARIRPYEVWWDGETYTFTCLGCFITCEGNGKTPMEAFEDVGKDGCSPDLREYALRVAAGWVDEDAVSS